MESITARNLCLSAIGIPMAELTYDVHSGVLVTRSNDGRDVVIAFAESGFSNYFWDTHQREQGKFGDAAHVRGGPIPVGRWRVHPPGSPHPDGGRQRSSWIPIGPVGLRRTLIYIHPAGIRTEGCIAILHRHQFGQVRDIVTRDGGGWLIVTAGDVV